MLFVLVVIHNRTCDESIACRSLKAQKDRDFRTLIYDNSETDHDIKKQCSENGWIYLGGSGNLGLPTAYNCAIDYLSEEKAEGFLCVLDDDTGLEDTFIADMVKATGETDADILLPVVRNKVKILSPRRVKRRTHFRTFEECAAESQDNILAFNSGMAISLETFQDYRYDEKLFLDCVDFSFLTEMKKRGKRIAVVPVNCEQSFSGAEKLPHDAAMNRFRIYTKDMCTFYGEKTAQCRYKLLKRALHLSMLYGSLEPFIILGKERENRT